MEEIEESDFEGVSQTCEKVYETPHPLERGKNQTFPPFKNTKSKEKNLRQAFLESSSKWSKSSETIPSQYVVIF